MKITINLEVKFRAFGITFGIVREGFEASLGIGGITFKEVPFNPTGSPTIDRRGVKVWVS